MHWSILTACPILVRADGWLRPTGQPAPTNPNNVAGPQRATTSLPYSAYADEVPRRTNINPAVVGGVRNCPSWGESASRALAEIRQAGILASSSLGSRST